VQERQGNLPAAVEAWERLVQAVPDRAYLAFERLEHAYRTLGTPLKFGDLCRAVIARNPQDWRARLALSTHFAEAGRAREAFDLLLDALPHNPHGVVIHQEVWRALGALHFEPSLVHRYIDLTRQAVFYLDPHVCVRCRYRSTELLWQCPQCHEWNTFVEERLAPAKDAGTVESEVP
jgi:lipopolysaccharide biosynthesis regulator YciM